MDTRIAKERKTARKKVIEAIRNHWCVGNEWTREQWVDWLKDQGMISPRTNARDCRTVTNTIAQLRSDTLRATIFGQPPEMAVAALRKERDRLRYAALENAAERDSLLDLRSRIHNIATGAEETKSDNEALILIARIIEASYLSNNSVSYPTKEG